MHSILFAQIGMKHLTAVTAILLVALALTAESLATTSTRATTSTQATTLSCADWQEQLAELIYKRDVDKQKAESEFRANGHINWADIDQDSEDICKLRD